ncbi:MAG: bifunctional (p)ppGpp synthetase/guanosine-3',5'-bis(diphosphate) 3'-pyrophosphohydrolase [Pseudomonadota bacterium]
MRQYELVERVLSYNPHANEDLLNRAYVYAMKAHGNQTRASGDPYFSHPLEVAAILTDLKLDDATIATALLHDTIEDTEVTRAAIEQTFGSEIADLVDGLTKIKKLDLVTREAKQAENFRKLLIAISSDIRVLLVKFADRLHNMRTLEHMKNSSRKRIAKETIEIYAPLAGRMGMQWLREELEDLSFRWLEPDIYFNLKQRLDLIRESNKVSIHDIAQQILEKLKNADIEADVTCREKRTYSIKRKMERKKLAFEQLSDIFGFRVIVDDMTDCYKALGVIHTNWHVVPGRFKDYISNPKQNDYRSLHTTIIGPSHQRVELQIRTQQMHDIAEYGVAAHTLYKDGLTALNGQTSKNAPCEYVIKLTEESNAYNWLRQLVEQLLEGDNSEEFLEHTKLELFRDQVFCFTPKGAIVALPSGATPIDFAYAVHTHIGNCCVGAKINGHHVPLITELRNGDEVEILTSKAQTPPPAWERIAITGKAKSAIRRATREAIRQQYGELGRQILIRNFFIHDKTFSEDLLSNSLDRLSHNTVSDVLSAVGRGELSSDHVVAAIYPDVDSQPKDQPLKRQKIKRQEDGWFNFSKMIGLKFRNPNVNAIRGANGHQANLDGIPIRGHQSDLPVTFAKGGAIPGDRIVGILTQGEGITIYPIHSLQLQDFDDQPERWIDLTWDIDDTNYERFPAQITVTCIDEPGTLAKITQVISETSGNIENINIQRKVSDFSDLLIDIEVLDLKHLNDIITKIKRIRVVNSVSRYYQ